MAGAADGPGGIALPAAGELFRVDRGLCAGAGTDKTAVGDQLGRPAERLSRAVESGAREHLHQKLHGQLLLDLSSVGVGHGCHFPTGGLSAKADAAAGAARHAQLVQPGCDALLRQEGQPVRRDPGELQRDAGTDMKRRQEGVRVKYQMNGNSAKFYDKAYSCWGNVLRAGETTINTVQGLLSYRAKEGGPRICSGAACGRESPTCIGGPKYRKTPMSDC